MEDVEGGGTPRLNNMCLALECEWIKDKKYHDVVLQHGTEELPGELR